MAEILDAIRLHSLEAAMKSYLANSGHNEQQFRMLQLIRSYSTEILDTDAAKKSLTAESETGTRGDFHERVVKDLAVSEGELWDELGEQWVNDCVLHVGEKAPFMVVHMSDDEVVELVKSLVRFIARPRAKASNG